MSDKEYKRLVKEAWKLLGVPRHDMRDFLTAVKDCVDERDELRDWKESHDLAERFER